MVEIHKRVGGPEAQVQLVARDHFPSSLQQQRQNTEGLFLYLDQPTFLTQFTRPKINLKDIKANYHRRRPCIWHPVTHCLDEIQSPRLVTQLEIPSCVRAICEKSRAS